MTRRQALLDAAARLPVDAPIPDSLLFAEGFDPSDTYILEIVEARKERPRYRWDARQGAWEHQGDPNFRPRYLWPSTHVRSKLHYETQIAGEDTARCACGKIWPCVDLFK
jgi:hypothetical protein